MKLMLLAAGLALACAPFFVGLSAHGQTINEFQPDAVWVDGSVTAGRAVAVTVNPTNTDHAIVASESGGLFKTANRGASWSHVDGLAMFRMRDVKYGPIMPGAGQVVIASGWSDSYVNDQGGLWWNTDAGQTWSRPKSSTRTCANYAGTWGIGFEPGTSNVFVGTDCGLAISRDYGVSWTHANLNPGGDSRVYSVAAQAGGIIDLSGAFGHRRSRDSGKSFAPASPGSMPGEGPHAIAVSPVESTVVFVASWATLHDCETAAALYEGDYQPDGTVVWTQVSPAFCRSGRPSWVATNPSRDGNPDHFDVYFGTGLEVYRQTVLVKGGTGPRCLPFVAIPSLGIVLGWSAVSLDHSDQNGMAFSTANNCAEFIVSDGGVHRPADERDLGNCGAEWRLSGPPRNGYHALQLYQVTGQMVLFPWPLPFTEPHTDLYIGTQDNHFHASSDGGLSWPFHTGNEGFMIQVPRYAPFDLGQTVTFNDPPRGNRTGAAHFETDLPWADPAGPVINNPTLVSGSALSLGPNVYIQYGPTYVGSGIWLENIPMLQLTTDNGATWKNVILVPLALASWPQLSVVGSEVTLYQAYVRPGTLPSGESRLGLFKITGIRTDGTLVSPTLSYADVSGLGSLGSFPLGEGTFLWQVPFAVDPNDPSHLIAPDVETHSMKVSTNGGANWNLDAQLTDLVTAYHPAISSREFRFDIPQDEYYASIIAPGGSLQVHVIAFDPFHRGHIVVGTEAAGMFFSTNNGAHWEEIPDSRKVTAISSVFFIDEYRNGNPFPEVIVATYGRGLWKVSLPLALRSLPFNLPPGVDGQWAANCWIRSPAGGCLLPADVFNFNVCPSCLYHAAVDGRINSIALTQEGFVQSLTIDGGRVIASTQDGQAVAPILPARTTQSGGSFDGCPECTRLVQQGGSVKGIVFDGGQIRAIIGGFGPLPAEDVLRQFSPPPAQAVPTPVATGPVGPYLYLTGTIPVAGQATAVTGGTVSVTGSGFCAEPGCATVALTIGSRSVTNVPVDANGGFHADFVVTELPGAYLVSAMQLTAGNQFLRAANRLSVTLRDVEPPPRLTITNIGPNSLVLSWPAEAQDFVLQWTSDLAGPNSWQAFPGQVITTGSQNMVFVQPTGTQRLFRLRKQE